MKTGVIFVGPEGLLDSAVAGGLKKLILICSLATGQLSIGRGGPCRFDCTHITYTHSNYEVLMYSVQMGILLIQNETVFFFFG